MTPEHFSEIILKIKYTDQNIMIKFLTISQLAVAQKKFYYKYHSHVDENVFMSSPAPEFLNPRAYSLCSLCGRLQPLAIDKILEKEIQDVIAKKKLALSS